MNEHARLTVDRNTHSIVLTRTLSGPCADVFAAWTEPEHVACWWDPAGLPLAECRIDLRPGGAFRFVNQDADHAFSGVYRRIEPPHRLVFDAMGATGTVTIEERQGQTALTVTIACASAEHLDQFLKIGIDAGTAKTLDNLVRYCDAKA